MNENADRRMCAGVILRTCLCVAIFLSGALSCGSDDKTVKCTGTCGNKCVDLQSDPLHCGRCDNSCGGNGTCEDGQCKCGDGQCTSTEVLCDIGLCKTCANLASDVEHCGDCGHRCKGTNAKCVSGVCACNPVQCSSNEVICDDGDCQVCAVLSSDLDHCGGCGDKCPRNGSCVSGVCHCPDNTINCHDICADLSSNVTHCGSCGNHCPAGGSCVSGVCQSP